MPDYVIRDPQGIRIGTAKTKPEALRDLREALDAWIQEMAKGRFMAIDKGKERIYEAHAEGVIRRVGCRRK